jgi:ATP/ADP translocase
MKTLSEEQKLIYDNSDPTNLTGIRADMYQLREFNDSKTDFSKLLMNISILTFALFAFILYPCCHMIYKNNTWRMYFTVGMCVIALFMIMFGPLYGWITSIL